MLTEQRREATKQERNIIKVNNKEGTVATGFDS
jgi:hypothetical protein